MSKKLQIEMKTEQERERDIQVVEGEDDEGVWDSMAVMSSELWNESSGPDELGMTLQQLIPNGCTNLTQDEACDKFLTAAQTGLLTAIKQLVSTFNSQLLIQYTDSDGYTALHRASYNGHLPVIEYLIDKGSDIHAKTHDGWEPLHCACRWNKVNVVSLLLQNGANMNALTNGRQTPLHLAACNDRAKMTLELLLLRDDIDVSIINNKGETARELALSYGRLGYLFEMKEESIDFKF